MIEDEASSHWSVEEFIGKTVGRQGQPSPGRIQEIGLGVFRSRRFRVCPPGVYRFHSHEEADEWMRQMAVMRAIEAETKGS